MMQIQEKGAPPCEEIISSLYLTTKIRRARSFISRGITPLILVDLDGTLFNNYARQLAIFKEILIPQYLELADIALENLDLSESMQPYSLLSLVSPFIPDKTRMESIKRTFLDAFLTNNFLDRDEIYAGAVGVIWQLHRIGCRIVYLTGRPADCMKEGTLESLKKFGFPIPDTDLGVELMMKPLKSMDDFDFKKNFLGNLQNDASRNVLGYLDNEATSCLFALEYFPTAFVVQFISTQSNNVHYCGPKLLTWK